MPVPQTEPQPADKDVNDAPLKAPPTPAPKTPTAAPFGPQQEPRADARAEPPKNVRYDAIRGVLAMTKNELAGDDGSSGRVLHVLFETKVHLAEAMALLQESGIDLERPHLEALQAHVDDVSRALNAFRAVVEKSKDAPVHASALRDLGEREQRLRGLLGLEAKPGPNATPSALDGGASRQGSVAPILEIIRIEASRAYAELAHDGKRDAIVGRVSPTLLRHLIYVRGAMGQDPNGQDAQIVHVHAAHVETASAEILKLRRWISGREGNASLQATFAPVIGELDALRTTVGLDSVMEMNAPAVSQRVHESEGAEGRAALDAWAHFDREMSGLQTLFEKGTERFEKVAPLKNTPSGGASGSMALAVRFLLMTATNIALPGVGTFVTSFVAAGLLREGTAAFITSSIEAEVKKTAQDTAKLLVKKHEKDVDSNQDVRERTLFAETMVQVQMETSLAVRDSIGTLLKEKKISADHLNAMAVAARTAAISMRDQAFRETAYGYAALQAHRGLTSVDAQDPKAKQAADGMDGYLDKNVHGSARKEGTSGVGKLRVKVTQDNDTLQVRFLSFQVHGMNNDMARAILEHAGHRLDNLQLPLEIEIEPPRWGMRSGVDFPFLVVDAKGTLRDARDWGAIKEAVKHKFFKAPRDVALIATPYACWEALKPAKLPSGIVKVV